MNFYNISKNLLIKTNLTLKIYNKINYNLNLKLILNLNYNLLQIKFDFLNVSIQKNNFYNLINSAIFFDNIILLNKSKLNYNNIKTKKLKKNLIKSLSILNPINFYLFFFQIKNFQLQNLFETNYNQNKKLNLNNLNILLKNYSYFNNSNIFYSNNRDWTTNFNLNFKYFLNNNKLNFIYLNLIYYYLKNIFKI